MLRKILTNVVLMPSFIKAVKDALKYNTPKEEWHMCWHIMGPKLYYKYLTGTAVEGVDFF